MVFRVNSPGGSVSASEVIRSELAAVRAAGKPVVVSMGGMAASGGYWVSTPADYIIASPSTLTGSIGIFGIINTYEKTRIRWACTPTAWQPRRWPTLRSPRHCRKSSRR